MLPDRRELPFVPGVELRTISRELANSLVRATILSRSMRPIASISLQRPPR